MTDPLHRLVDRRDRAVRVAKLALAMATCLWLAGMALYERGVDEAGVSRDLLLTARGSLLLSLADVEPLPIRRIWGGPWTLFGLQCAAGALGTIGMVALFRARMDRGRLSRPGLASVAAALVLATLAAGEGASAVYAATIDRTGLARLLGFVEMREPGLVARLRAGERLSLPDRGGASVRLVAAASGRIVPDLPPGQPLLRDRADAEGLRFLLAEQAYRDGDRATLRRVLPLALAMPSTDRPARDDFARRLAAIERYAGVPATPPADRPWVAAGAARWRATTGLTLVLRYCMQVCLVIGLAASALALVLRRRVGAIRRQVATIAMREPSSAFGRRVTQP